MILKHGGTLGC